jgi:hypothetical protein
VVSPFSIDKPRYEKMYGNLEITVCKTLDTDGKAAGKDS